MTSVPPVLSSVPKMAMSAPLLLMAPRPDTVSEPQRTRLEVALPRLMLPVFRNPPLRVRPPPLATLIVPAFWKPSVAKELIASDAPACTAMVPSLVMVSKARAPPMVTSIVAWRRRVSAGPPGMTCPPCMTGLTNTMLSKVSESDTMNTEFGPIMSITPGETPSGWTAVRPLTTPSSAYGPTSRVPITVTSLSVDWYAVSVPPCPTMVVPDNTASLRCSVPAARSIVLTDANAPDSVASGSSSRIALTETVGSTVTV